MCKGGCRATPGVRGITTDVHGRQGLGNDPEVRSAWGWLALLMVSNLAAGPFLVPMVPTRVAICFVWIFGNLIKETMV